ncbi:MAG TPA: helix-turn-helix domain-containing protein [Thermoanaerobaculia bacterium]|jgi:DNA-binding NtrC family response regulator
MKALILDPVGESRDILRRALAEGGGQARAVESVSEARRHLLEFQPDIVVAAVSPASPGGAELLAEALAANPRRAAWALVDSDRLEDAVAAMERGAHDFLWRPISLARLAALRARLERRRERENSTEQIRLRLAHAEMDVALPGESARWRQATSEIERAAASEDPVLLTGEAGTEKETAALCLHRLSSRGAQPFAIAHEGLLTESAGATGTLLVTGVEEASEELQRALLEELTHPAGRRLIVSLDGDPAALEAEGKLIPGLVAALSGPPVHLPPLRERGGDVELLARRFLRDLDAHRLLEVEALDALLAHPWPGNVRELREAIRRAVYLSGSAAIGSMVMRSVLGRPLATRRSRRKRAPVVRIAVGDSLADVERRLIQKTLEFARGNKKKTAELLKLSLKTIYNKIKEYGLEG